MSFRTGLKARWGTCCRQLQRPCGTDTPVRRPRLLTLAPPQPSLVGRFGDPDLLPRTEQAGLAHPCTTTTEAAPPVAVFDGWAPLNSILESPVTASGYKSACMGP